MSVLGKNGQKRLVWAAVPPCVLGKNRPKRDCQGSFAAVRFGQKTPKTGLHQDFRSTDKKALMNLH
jgi:hypothetical protein